MLGPEAPGCLVARSTVASPSLPILGPKISMLTVFSITHSLEKKENKIAHGSTQRPELPPKKGL